MTKKLPRLRKYTVLFICFILSFFSWIIVKMSENYTAKYQLEIMVTNIPKNKILTYCSDSILTVTFEDKGLSLLPVEFLSKKIKINYEDITSSYQKQYNNICLQEKQIIKYIQNQHRFSENIKRIQPKRICLHLKDNE